MRIFKIINPEHFMRPMFLCLREENKKDLIGVEIGAASGENAKRVLKNISIKQLYCIDPWVEYEEDNKLDAHSRSEQNRSEQRCKKLLKPWNDKIVYIKKYSSEAVGYLPNNLDFVYIDGNHQYEFVKKDIELYYPKVKPGGVIGGDDFCGNFVGVIRAVLEFVDNHDLELHSRINDWWIVKPKEK